MTSTLFVFQLKPHIAALPPSVRTINVCMADGVVLDALYALNPDQTGHVEYSLLTTDQLAKQRTSPAEIVAVNDTTAFN